MSRTIIYTTVALRCRIYMSPNWAQKDTMEGEFTFLSRATLAKAPKPGLCGRAIDVG